MTATGTQSQVAVPMGRWWSSGAGRARQRDHRRTAHFGWTEQKKLVRTSCSIECFALNQPEQQRRWGQRTGQSCARCAKRRHATAVLHRRESAPPVGRSGHLPGPDHRLPGPDHHRRRNQRIVGCWQQSRRHTSHRRRTRIGRGRRGRRRLSLPTEC